MSRLSTRLNRLESQSEFVSSRYEHTEEIRAALDAARKLHPRDFERFDEFFSRGVAKYSNLARRELLIELSKEPRALEIARELTALIVAQSADRSGELQ